MGRVSCKKVQDVIRKAVRPGAHRQSDHAVKGQGLIPYGFQLLPGGVGIGVGLKVTDEPIRPSPGPGQTALHLFFYGQALGGGAGARSPGIAEQTSPGACFSVPIRAGKTGVQRNFSYRSAETAGQIILEAEISQQGLDLRANQLNVLKIGSTGAPQ